MDSATRPGHRLVTILETPKRHGTCSVPAMDQTHQKNTASWGQLQERLSEPIRSLYRKLTSQARRQLGGSSDKRQAELAKTLDDHGDGPKAAPEAGRAP